MVSPNRMTRLTAVSLTLLVLSAALLGVLIWKADKLTAFGLTGHVYFFALVPLGLSAAALLFGVLRSTALWKGSALGGVLELGGPVVLFCLIQLGGLLLVPNASTFPLTVYVHGENGPQEVLLRNSGKVVLRLGLEPRSAAIGADGQAFFPAIPANFRNQSVPVWIDSDEFETLGDVQRQLAGPSIDITICKKSATVAGLIQEDNDGFIPVPGAEIRIASITARSGAVGEFSVVIPGDRMQSQLDMDVSARGYKPLHTTVIPNSNTVVIKLTRLP